MRNDPPLPSLTLEVRQLPHLLAAARERHTIVMTTREAGTRSLDKSLAQEQGQDGMDDGLGRGQEQLDEAEVRRQLLLSHHLGEALGGVLPAGLVDVSAIQTVLDVACGAGGWTLDLACSFPRMQITGIDASAQQIATAHRLAHEGGFSNVCFLVQDPRRLREVATGLPGVPFDLIHLAFLASMLFTLDYPALLRALWQLCRPGGMLCWTETAFPITNSPALACRALELAGQRLTPVSMHKPASTVLQDRHTTGEEFLLPAAHHLGILPMLGCWLRQAGYQQVQQRLTSIEVSAGTEAHACFALQLEAFTRRIRPLLLKQEVIAAAAYDVLRLQVQEEVGQETFCGCCVLLTACARRPL